MAGIWGISDSTGTFTYYSTIADVTASAVAGDIVQLFADYTTSREVWVLKDGVNYNLNGHTYTCNDAGAINAVEDSGGSVTCKIWNGKILRTNGTASTSNSRTFSIANTDTTLRLHNVEVVSDFGEVIDSFGRIYGGIFRSTRASFDFGAICVSMNRRSQWYFCQAYTIGNWGFNTISDDVRMINCYGYSQNTNPLYDTVSSTYVFGGLFESDGALAVRQQGQSTHFNVSAYSTGNSGQEVRGFSFNAIGYSTSSYGIYFWGASNPDVCRLVGGVSRSTASYGIRMFYTRIIMYKCNGFSTASIGGGISGESYQCTFETTANFATNRYAYGKVGSSLGSIINAFQHTSKVANSANFNMASANVDSWYFGKNTFENSTTSVDPDITNLQTNSEDSFGNILIG
jgi:hypothetical protein